MYFFFSHNRLIERSCQKQCQHTSCQACYFKTKRESRCSKCATDDFKCMLTFSKCVRREQCTKHKFPCEPHQKVCFFKNIYFLF